MGELQIGNAGADQQCRTDEQLTDRFSEVVLDVGSRPGPGGCPWRLVALVAASAARGGSAERGDNRRNQGQSSTSSDLQREAAA
jgi:hypothetical protein